METILEQATYAVELYRDQGMCLEDAIDWALEQLPGVSKTALAAACVADMSDCYE